MLSPMCASSPPSLRHSITDITGYAYLAHARNERFGRRETIKLAGQSSSPEIAQRFESRAESETLDPIKISAGYPVGRKSEESRGCTVQTPDLIIAGCLRRL